jgi:glycogen debranching enzyme
MGEWLLANGLGGYALGPRSGPPTRGYHGWLIAATTPPDGRRLMVGAIEATATIDGGAHRVDELELAPGQASRDGIGLRLEAWMPRDTNATCLRWTRTDASSKAVRIRLTPLVAGRDHHPGGDGPEPAAVTTSISDDQREAIVSWPPGRDVPALRIAVDGGRLVRDERTAWVDYPEEVSRGTATGERLQATVALEADLGPGDSVSLVIGVAAGSRAVLPSPAGIDRVAEADATRAATLLDDAGPAADDARVTALVLAADRFLVHRPDLHAHDPDEGVTVIAGYPWFGDWGRDTMIALPGLTLTTGRHAEARRILRTWASLVRDGLLPNHFPQAGVPAYHAIDAPLWFVHALGAYERATGDATLPRELRPAVEQITGAYTRGTRFGIGIDPADGLVRGGEGGLQLTWMDARVDGVAITPRHGKPVEIQALWIEGCRLAARWATADGDEEAASAHRTRADRATISFRARFPIPDRAWLRDVVDGPHGDDRSLRPNQLLALSLVPDILDATRARAVVDAVATHLVVPGGVRTLAPFEPGYRARFQGPPAFRDSAYHQGPAWTWLLGPWLDAVLRVRGIRDARAELARHLDALDPDATGAIPELLEPEPPFATRGCPWQAWGVAELLRCAGALSSVREPFESPHPNETWMLGTR